MPVHWIIYPEEELKTILSRKTTEHRHCPAQGYRLPEPDMSTQMSLIYTMRKSCHVGSRSTVNLRIRSSAGLSIQAVNHTSIDVTSRIFHRDLLGTVLAGSDGLDHFLHILSLDNPLPECRPI